VVTNPTYASADADLSERGWPIGQPRSDKSAFLETIRQVREFRIVSAIVAHPASGENVRVSCERRRLRAAHGEGGSRGVFPMRATTTAADSKARCASSSEIGLVDVGGALIPRMHSRPVEVP